MVYPGDVVKFSHVVVSRLLSLSRDQIGPDDVWVRNYNNPILILAVVPSTNELQAASEHPADQDYDVLVMIGAQTGWLRQALPIDFVMFSSSKKCVSAVEWYGPHA